MKIKYENKILKINVMYIHEQKNKYCVLFMCKKL